MSSYEEIKYWEDYEEAPVLPWKKKIRGAGVAVLYDEQRQPQTQSETWCQTIWGSKGLAKGELIAPVFDRNRCPSNERSAHLKSRIK